MLKVIINIENQQLQFEAKTFMLEGNRLTIELPDASVKLNHEPAFYPVPKIEQQIVPPVQVPSKPYKRRTSTAPKAEKGSALKGKPAATGVKVCPICHQEYKPSGNAQVICQACKITAKEAGKSIYKTPAQNRYPDDTAPKDKKDYYGAFDDKAPINKELLDPMGLKGDKPRYVPNGE